VDKALNELTPPRRGSVAEFISSMPHCNWYRLPRTTWLPLQDGGVEADGTAHLFPYVFKNGAF
jgi:hypothetical protein